jgi:hypothetical protein
VVADAAPGPDLGPDVFAFDPPSAIRADVRSAKAGPPEVHDWCGLDGGTGDRQRLEDAGAAPGSPEAAGPAGPAAQSWCRASNSASATTSASASSRRWPSTDCSTRSALAARSPQADR